MIPEPSITLVAESKKGEESGWLGSWWMGTLAISLTSPVRDDSSILISLPWSRIPDKK